MPQPENKVFHWVTWITALGALACMLLPEYVPHIVLPLLLFTAVLVLGVDLVVSWKGLNRYLKWSIGLSIIIWAVLGGFLWPR